MVVQTPYEIPKEELYPSDSLSTKFPFGARSVFDFGTVTYSFRKG